MMRFPAPNLKNAAQPCTRQMTWPPTTTSLRALAVHEAGHLCVALVEDLRKSDRLVARIYPDGSLGSVDRYAEDGSPRGDPGRVLTMESNSFTPSPYLQRRALSWAAMFAAGYAAEALAEDYAHTITGWPAPLADTDDFRNAAALISFAWPGDHTCVLWTAWRFALHLLSREWDWVLRIADEIDTTGECDNERATELRARCDRPNGY